jgi:aquaporin Z
MNPARSLAPAMISGHTEHLWIYLIATIGGAALAIPTWKYLSSTKNKEQ